MAKRRRDVIEVDVTDHDEQRAALFALAMRAGGELRIEGSEMPSGPWDLWRRWTADGAFEIMVVDRARTH